MRGRLFLIETTMEPARGFRDRDEPLAVEFEAMPKLGDDWPAVVCEQEQSSIAGSRFTCKVVGLREHDGGCAFRARHPRRNDGEEWMLRLEVADE